MSQTYCCNTAEFKLRLGALWGRTSGWCGPKIISIKWNKTALSSVGKLVFPAISCQYFSPDTLQSNNTNIWVWHYLTVKLWSYLGCFLGKYCHHMLYITRRWPAPETLNLLQYVQLCAPELRVNQVLSHTWKSEPRFIRLVLLSRCKRTKDHVMYMAQVL